MTKRVQPRPASRPIACTILLLFLALMGCSKSAADHIKIGNELFNKGEYKEAEIRYRKAIQVESNSGEAHYRLGLTLLKTPGKKFEAYQALKSASQMAPGLMDALLKQSELALEGYAQGGSARGAFYGDLREVAKKLLAKDPQSVDGLRIQGLLSLADQKPAEAVTTFRKAYQVNPSNPEIVHGMVQSLIVAGESAEAEQLATSFLQKDKAFGLLYDDLYAISLSRRKPEEGERIFRLKVENNPGVAAYRLQLAAHYVNNNKPREAQEVLRPLIEDSKTFPTGLVEAADFQMRLGNWNEAISALEAASKSSQNRQVALKKLVRPLVAVGRLKDAIKVAEDVVKEYPSDHEARFVQATLWLDLNEPAKTEAAIKELEQLSSDYQRDPRYWSALGQAYQRSGETAKSANAWREALKADGDFRPALLAMAQQKLSVRDAAGALPFAERAANLDPRDPNAGLLYATVLTQSGRLAEARNRLNSLSSAYPNLGAVQVQLGLILLAERKFDQAELVLKRVYRPGQTDLASLRALTEVYLAQKQTNTAISLVNAELRQQPDSAELQQLLGRVALASNRPELAIEQFQKLTAAQPKVAINHFFLGQAFRAAGNLDGAISSLQTAEQLEPDNAPAISVLAFLLQEAGRDSDAIARFRHLRKLRPDDPNTMNNLAFLLANTGQGLDEAKQLAEKARAAAPKDTSYADTLGWVFLKSKSFDQANKIFEQCVQREPSNPVYLYHLGLAQIAIGQKPAARKNLALALEQHPSKDVERQIHAAMTQVAN